MTINARRKKTGKPKSFFDFTMFSVVVVRPFTMFTPSRSAKLDRVTPFRKRGNRSSVNSWERHPVFYVGEDFDSKEAGVEGLADPTEPEVEQWGEMARKARLTWMDENPY